MCNELYENAELTFSDIEAVVAIGSTGIDGAVTEVFKTNIQFNTDLQEYACDMEDLFHKIDLPETAGVYLFKGKTEVQTLDDWHHEGTFTRLNVSVLIETTTHNEVAHV
ncbi:hypothetical protein [Pseudoalteromonas luteoviolacea]|uniref:hypothetical protein n=1 Tax=Pseudoalteromonas luteoviolacea TaxID=43657 RepID=UPI001B35BA2C|nr:hypothetical protein [Pseudoalteromonas luteoviolacea]MBQ4836081.1 hypothetical protein [Pseudoalteromonas luteoviolacea]